MGLTRFRRRFQVLDPLLAKKFLSATEGIDERKVRGDECRPGYGPRTLLFHRGGQGTTSTSWGLRAGLWG